LAEAADHGCRLPADRLDRATRQVRDLASTLAQRPARVVEMIHTADADSSELPQLRRSSDREKKHAVAVLAWRDGHVCGARGEWGCMGAELSRPAGAHAHCVSGRRYHRHARAHPRAEAHRSVGAERRHRESSRRRRQYRSGGRGKVCARRLYLAFRRANARRQRDAAAGEGVRSGQGLRSLMLVATAQDVLVVPPNSPFHSVKELIDYAKAHPGELNYASLGTGTSGHLATVMFSDLAGIKLQHVPYTSVSQAATDVMSGRMAVFLPTLGGHIGNVTAGRM